MTEKAPVSGKQKIQEQQYVFPYHHVARFRPGFRSTYFVKYGLKRVSAFAFILDQLKQLKFDHRCDLESGVGRLRPETAREFLGINITGINYSERAIYLDKVIGPEANLQREDIIVEDTDQVLDVAEGDCDCESLHLLSEKK